MRSANTGNARVGSRIVMAVVAVLMAVTAISCEPVVDAGVRSVTNAEDGSVVAKIEVFSIGELTPMQSATTSDGGRTWAIADGVNLYGNNRTAQTPRGTYAIRNSGIMLLGSNGNETLAYSTAHFQQEGNLWLQATATGHLGNRDLTTRPFGIAYDGKTGNVIVTMGIEGVLVGAPDGTWMGYAVGPYTPNDYSFIGKTRGLISSGFFWATALVVSLSIAGFALILLQYERRELWFLFGGLLVALVLLVFGALVLYLDLFSPMIMFLAIVLGSVALALNSKTQFSARKSLLFGLGILSLLVSGVLFATFGFFDRTLRMELSFGFALLTLLAYILAIAVLASLERYFRHWRAVGVTLLGMNVIVFLVFMLWLHVGVSSILARVLAVALLAIAALMLARYVKRRQNGLDPCAERSVSA